MKDNLRTALVATALCALVAAPSASAGDPVLPTSQYAKYAKIVNGVEFKDSTNAVKTAVSEVVDAAGDQAQQAVGEVAAALAAVAAEKGGDEASSLFGNVVAAAAAAGSDKAESLGFAKVAAAAGALVSGGADFVSAAGDGLSKSVAKEVKAAAGNADEALSGLDGFAMKQVYDETLAVLRGGSYKMKGDTSEDFPSVTPEMDPLTGSGSREDGTTLPASGIYVGAPQPAPVVPPAKKHKKNPTPTGL